MQVQRINLSIARRFVYTLPSGKKYVPSNPQHGSTAERQHAPQRYTCDTPGSGWDLHFLTIFHLTYVEEREPSPTKHPPATHHPNDQATTTAVQQQWSSTYGPIHNGSTVLTTAVYLWYVAINSSGMPGEAGWNLHFSTILHLPGESASRPRERLFMHPARGVGTRRPLCRRGHRGLMCGEGVARACGRQEPGGEL